MKTLAIYPGSFDPITLGHLSVLRRATKVFEAITVVVVHNPKKSALLSADERVDLIRGVLRSEGLDSVSVSKLEGGLLVDFAKEIRADVILKGFRTEADIEYELPMAQVNRDLTAIETIFFPSEPEFGYVSSSLVKEVAALGGNVSSYVPAEVADVLRKRFTN